MGESVRKHASHSNSLNFRNSNEEYSLAGTDSMHTFISEAQGTSQTHHLTFRFLM